MYPIILFVLFWRKKKVTLFWRDNFEGRSLTYLNDENKTYIFNSPSYDNINI